jgi:hypothetical protein
MAARSVDVLFRNATPSRLVRQNYRLLHGIWGPPPPPEIAPSAEVQWRSESSGFMTGTEGEVIFGLPSGDQVRFHWNNPYYGSNTYQEVAPGGYTISHAGGQANRTTVIVTLNGGGVSTTPCSADFVNARLDHQPQPALDFVSQFLGFFTTPVFKRNGIHGWVQTGCTITGLLGRPVRRAQHSTDGFYTLDVRIEQLTVAGVLLVSGWAPERYIRIEVEPGTHAHTVCDGRSPDVGDRLTVGGPLLIDTDGPFLEIHPTDEFLLG